jgi:ATP-dependent RNA helicase DeaD
MTGGLAYDAFLSLAVDLSTRDDGRGLLAYALKYFFTHHRMEKAQARAAGEKLLESHKVEQVHREQKKARGEHDRSRRKPRMERSETPSERAEGDAKPQPQPQPEKDTPSERTETPLLPVDRVKLFVAPGGEDGWDKDSFASALSALARQPRESILAVDLKPRYAYVLVIPGSEQAYLAVAGRPLKEKPLTIEIARPRKR